MGRIVGDGAINFDIVDVAVDPAHQGKGLGRLVMEKLVAWLDANAFDGAYVTLVADAGTVREVRLRKRSPGERGDGPRLANPQSLARISCQEKRRCPNGNSSYGAFLTMLNAIHIARIP